MNVTQNELPEKQCKCHLKNKRKVFLIQLLHRISLILKLKNFKMKEIFIQVQENVEIKRKEKLIFIQ